jgi:hypothetical protein
MIRTRFLALSDVESWVYTPNSTMVNEARFGYDRISFNFVNVDINTFADGKGYPINTGAAVGGFPNVTISGFVNAGITLGTASNRPQFNSPNPYWDLQDSFSYLKGKHAIKFGGEFTHIEADSGIFVDGRGLFNFNGGVFPVGSGPSTALEEFFAGLLRTDFSSVATQISKRIGHRPPGSFKTIGALRRRSLSIWGCATNTLRP